MISSLYNDIKSLLTQARSQALRTVNTIIVETYRKIGERIVLEEQQGEQRAEYGKGLLKELAKQLKEDFGSGFDERALRRMRQFYLTFPKRSAVRPELSWTHYRSILAVTSEKARSYYITQTLNHGRSARALDKQISTLAYERMPAIKDNETGQIDIQSYIADPIMLDFLGFEVNQKLYESNLEQAIIDNLQQFLLACGHGFSFVARQKRILTETNDFYIDLVFYNYLLKCFIIIDLKTSQLTHQDIGQMDMYVRMYDDLHRLPGDNPTLGLVLCTHKDETIVKYSVLAENTQLFASTYMLHLPSEEALKSVIENTTLYKKLYDE